MPVAVFPWNDETIKQLKELVEQGLSSSQIGLTMHTSRNTIIGKVHRLGLQLRARGNTTEAKVECVKRVKPRLLIYRTYGVKLKNKRRSKHRLAPVSLSRRPVAGFIDPNHKCNLMELTAHTCRWPLWRDDQSTRKFYCGAYVDGTVYCEGHTLMATRDTPYLVYSSREPAASLVTNTLPEKSPKAIVA